MEISQFKALLNNDDYLALEQYWLNEIRKAEKKAIASMLTNTPDIENANRAKFYEEFLNITRNKVASSWLNSTNTKI